MNRTNLVFCLIAALLLSLLTGCQPKVVEKVGVLPDRTTQLVAHQTDEEEEPQSKSWDVQNIDDLLLTSADMRISNAPSTYYYNGTAFLHRIVSDDNTDFHSLEAIQADGALNLQYSLSLPSGTACYYSPDGTALVYEAWLEGCLTLILRNLNTQEERIV